MHLSASPNLYEGYEVLTSKHEWFGPNPSADESIFYGFVSLKAVLRAIRPPFLGRWSMSPLFYALSRGYPPRASSDLFVACSTGGGTRRGDL